MSNYEQVKERFKRQGIEYQKYSIFISGINETLDGVRCGGCKISKDNRWVCVPIQTDEHCNYTDIPVFIPQCYEVIEKYTAFLGEGMLVNSEVYLLR